MIFIAIIGRQTIANLKFNIPLLDIDECLSSPCVNISMSTCVNYPGYCQCKCNASGYFKVDNECLGR